MKKGSNISILQAGKLSHGAATWLLVIGIYPFLMALGQAEVARGLRTESNHHLLKEYKGNGPSWEDRGMTHTAALVQPKCQHYPGR